MSPILNNNIISPIILEKIYGPLKNSMNTEANTTNTNTLKGKKLNPLALL